MMSIPLTTKPNFVQPTEIVEDGREEEAELKMKERNFDFDSGKREREREMKKR